MLSTKEIIDQAASLPTEERAAVIDSLLKTLNPTNDEIDRKWIEVAKRRLYELRSGEVEPVPGDEVFKKIRVVFQNDLSSGSK